MFSSSASLVLACACGLLAAPSPARGATWVAGPSGPPGPSPRHDHAVAFDAARGRIVLFGGLYVSASDETWEYDGVAWRTGPPAPPALGPRFSHAMAFDAARQRIVLFGGYAPFNVASDTWEYDGAAWTPGPAPPPGLVARAQHAMAWDASQGKTILFGGWDGSAALGDTWLYDGASFTAGPPAPPGLTARMGAMLCYDSARARTVLFGGYDTTYRNDTWELSGGAWIAGPAPPSGLTRRMTAGAFDAARGLTVIYGGATAGGALGDAWLYDGVSWTPGATAPPELGPRGSHAAAFDTLRGVFVVIGGQSGNDERGDAWELDAAGWREGARVLTARVGASLTLDRKRGRLVLFGGHDGGWRNDAWLFDGGRWTPGPSAPPALEGRLLHASAYLASRDRVVVFGGASQREEYLSDTWEYDGTGWTAGPAAPPAMVGRNGHGMAYDAARQRIVLFGGFHSLLMPSAYLSDTWEYDGFAWSGGPAPPPGMSGRSQFGMAFDERRGRTVVAAGGAGPGVFLDDVWEYDGAAWTPGVPPPAGLTPRYGLRMAWDDASGSIVLFGGNDGVYKNDTWAYDGATWSAGPTAPAGLLPRDGHAMARLGGALVLFGGYTPSTQSSLADEWEYVAPSSIVAGRGPGPTEANEVRVFAATGAYSGVGFLAYAAGGRGVNVASGDVGESGRGEILTAPGPGPTLGPHVRAFRGDGSAIAKVSFFAYGTLRYGANVTGARADGDGYAEIVTGAGYGPPFGPHVRGFDYDGTTLRPISAVSFFAYGTLRYGANVAGGDVDVDAFDELLTGPGPGPTFGPQVRGFDYDGFQIAPIAGLSFMAFATSAFGARVASGDVEGDGPSEIVAATGPGIPPSVAGFSFDGTGVAPLPGFTTTGGGMDLADIDADGDEDLIAGDGVDPAATSALRLFTYDGTQLAPALSFTPFPGSTGYGANAAGAVLGF